MHAQLTPTTEQAPSTHTDTAHGWAAPPAGSLSTLQGGQRLCSSIEIRAPALASPYQAN